MKKLIVLLLLGAGVYFTVQNWGTGMFDSPQAFFGITDWGERNVAGVRFDLPCPLERFRPANLPKMPSNISAEFFRGRAGGRKIYVTHLMNLDMAGGVMFTWADTPLVAAANKLELNVISGNTATTMIGGLRARRSDYISINATPRIRVRGVLLERANHLWFVECHAAESDAGAEADFLKIVSSAREL